jgi:TetR/AcrR family transcriptional regulator, lmrAB and yxaGH operons repressor
MFRQRGYNGVGLTELLAASGAPKGSFYHHFPGGKEQLAEAAVRYAGGGVGRLIDDAFVTAGEFSAGVMTLVERIADFHEASGYRDGCPVTSVLLDTVPQSALISSAVTAVFDDWEVRVTGHAHRLGLSTFGPPDARRLLMLIEGAWILARTYRSRDPMTEAARTFVNSIGVSR